MIAVRCLFSIGLIFMIAGSALAAPTEATPDRYEALIKRQPMIFFIAKGAPGACGPGCSEWIAAEGAIDLEAAKRFREFLDGLPRRDLPIYFSSIGGGIGQALRIAELLREYRMIAAVGRTFPDGCGKSNVDESCRRVMQSKREHKARLVTKDARCISACVYALLGGSQRKVAPDAKLGIHSARMNSSAVAQGQSLTVEESHNLTRTYIVELGIDPGLIDAAAKISADRIHIMRRDEISRYGVESGEFETRWFAHKVGGIWHMSKSITQANPAGTKGYRTSTVRLACREAPAVGKLVLFYRREVLADETEAPRVYVSMGDEFWFMQAGKAAKAAHIVQANVTFEAAKRAGAKPAIEVMEWFSVANEKRTRAVNFSTGGMTEAVEELQSRCNGVQPDKTLPKRAQATAR